MKIASTSIALFLTATFWDKTTAQDSITSPFNGDCLYAETKCFAEDGTPCRKIKQRRKKDGCGSEKITISSEWCNYTGQKRTIYANQGPILTLTGPAATSLNGKNDVTFSPRDSGLIGDIERNECQGGTWTTEVNTCSAFFNYELNVFASEDTNQESCRGYNFQRQMKSLCRLTGSVSCTVLDGKNGGAGTPCEQVQACDYYKGDDKGEECFHDVRYDFEYKNNNNQPIRFDLQGEKVTRALVAWKSVSNANTHFDSVIERKSNYKFSHVREKVNTCKVLPSATLNLRANVLDSKTNSKDAGFQFCFHFDSFKVVKFPDAQTTCKSPTPTPPSNPSKGKGGNQRRRMKH